MTFNKNILNITLLVLLAANVVTLGLSWFKKPQLPPAPGQGGVIEFLSKELNFDERQKTDLKKLVEEHRNGTRDLRDMVKQQKDNFFDLLKTGNISDSAIEKASFTAMDAQRKMDISVFRHFQQIRTLCNAEQKKKFDEIVKEALHQFRSPQGPPPGDRRPGGPPPPQQ
jgi:Spy/CpxP family protein refolding chaperone